MTEIARRVKQAEITRAHKVERDFKAGIHAINAAWVRMAEFAHQIHTEKLWKLAGHESIEEFLGQPDVQRLSRSGFFRLVQIWEELVVIREVAPARLEQVDLTLIHVVLPAICKGDVAVDKGLDDAEALSRSDLRLEYQSNGRGPDAALDAGEEPGHAKCPKCAGRGWVEAK